jgi:hypothetical protein
MTGPSRRALAGAFAALALLAEPAAAQQLGGNGTQKKALGQRAQPNDPTLVPLVVPRAAVGRRINQRLSQRLNTRIERFVPKQATPATQPGATLYQTRPEDTLDPR